MVKIRAGDMAIFGLTRINLERLFLNDPIVFNLSAIGFDYIDVFIMADTGRKEDHDLVLNKYILPWAAQQRCDLMVIALSNDDRTALQNNIQKLITLTLPNGKKISVGIVYGETEISIYQMFKKYIDPFKTTIMDYNAGSN